MAENLDKQIVSLRRAMASGVLTVESADTGRVTYRSYTEMRQALGDLQQLKAAEDAKAGTIGPRRTRQVVTTGRSGW